MNLKQELINRLGVPENWDKYDYKTQRYSFDDMQEVLDDIVKKSSIPVVVLSFDELKDKIIKHKAKSEYKQASIIILRNIFEENES